jgi:SAM-dependent methyltransferase
MCNEAVVAFARRVITDSDVEGRRVLEVGSYDTTGSVRPFVEAMRPSSYVGVDIVPGPRVDLICDVRQLEQRFGRESFDLVIATEIVEHVRDWRAAWSNMKAVLRMGGLLIVTTRSLGFPFHFGPFDYWRYELDDARAIVAEMELVAAEADPIAPGVLVAARKSATSPASLADVALHSMVLGRRSLDVSSWDILRFRLTTPRQLVRLVIPSPVRRLFRRRSA